MLKNLADPDSAGLHSINSTASVICPNLSEVQEVKVTFNNVPSCSPSHSVQFSINSPAVLTKLAA
jgi:hypothetical protein